MKTFFYYFLEFYFWNTLSLSHNREKSGEKLTIFFQKQIFFMYSCISPIIYKSTMHGAIPFFTYPTGCKTSLEVLYSTWWMGFCTLPGGWGSVLYLVDGVLFSTWWMRFCSLPGGWGSTNCITKKIITDISTLQYRRGFRV